MFLKVYNSGKLIVSRQFREEHISIGSGSDGPSLILADPSVCFWHALIQKMGGEYYISDLGSPTGTFVNSKPVLEAPLKHGDEIKIGDFDIHFFTEVPFVINKAQETKSKSKKETGASSLKETEIISPASIPLPDEEETIPLKKSIESVSSSNLDVASSSSGSEGTDNFKSSIAESSPSKISSPPTEEILPPKEISSLKEAPPSRPDPRTSSPSSIRELSFSKQRVPENKTTFAPHSEVEDLDTYIPVGSGPVIEVLLTWKERILSIHHFQPSAKKITFGSDPEDDIVCPNLTGKSSYELLTVGSQTHVYLSEGVKASLINKKGQKHSFDTLIEKNLITNQNGHQAVTLSQNQLLRLDFSEALRVYVRYTNRAQKAAPIGFFGFSFSEMMGLMMSIFFMSMLFFYLTIYSTSTLDSEEDLETVKKATIEFNPPKRKRVVKLKLAKKAQKKRARLVVPTNKLKKTVKKSAIKKKGTLGRIGQVAAKKKKFKKQGVTSARPGGSVNTKKKGAGARSPRPDPSKVGLLGVFGTKGAKKQLDKAYSGSGELAGLAEQATGSAGQSESYYGEGIGTKFKSTAAGGKGSALIGVSSGIKTKGRGGGTRGYGRGGSLGQRGRVQLDLGTSDWEVEGGIDKSAILRVIRRNKYQLEQCYELALQRKPGLEGKVLLQWNIVNERVRNVKTRNNSTRDVVLARCLMSRLRNFRFTGTGLKKGQIGEVNIPFVVTKK